jgi:hypothetical protein
LDCKWNCDKNGYWPWWKCNFPHPDNPLKSIRPYQPLEPFPRQGNKPPSGPMPCDPVLPEERYNPFVPERPRPRAFPPLWHEGEPENQLPELFPKFWRRQPVDVPPEY